MALYGVCACVMWRVLLYVRTDYIYMYIYMSFNLDNILLFLWNESTSIIDIVTKYLNILIQYNSSNKLTHTYKESTFIIFFF